MNKPLIFLVASNSINVLADYLFIPLYALFISKIGGGPQIAGILFGVRFISSVLFGFIVAKINDKKRLDDLLLETNFFLKGSCWLILAFYQTIPMMIIIQIILGISGSFGGPAFNSLISEHLDNKKHIRDWGIWELVQNGSVAIASILSGFLLTAYGFKFLFIAMAILEFTSLAVLYYTKNIKKIV